MSVKVDEVPVTRKQKFKCFFGFHNWRSTSWKPEIFNLCCPARKCISCGDWQGKIPVHDEDYPNWSEIYPKLEGETQ